MKRYAVEWRTIAWLLAFVAGFVDVQGYLSLGGYFVSFLSGNSTRFGVALVSHAESAARLAGVLAAFVAGVTAGTLAGAAGERWRRSVALWYATAGLCLSVFSQHFGFTYPSVCLLAHAMGAVNAIFVENGEVTVGVTYMTGTLVKLGQRIGAALRGAPLSDALPYFLHWCGLVSGGVAGTLVFEQRAFNALWIPIAITFGVSVAVHRLTRNAPDRAVIS